MVSSLTAAGSGKLQLHELVYTSAEALLEGGSGHLGVVASTREFPPDVASELQQYRGYTMLPGLSIDRPALHPPRLIVGPVGDQDQWCCFTHVAYAGADHTGRTTPIAHHFAVSREELDEADVDLAALLHDLRLRFLDRWRDTPKWIEPAASFILANNRVEFSAAESLRFLDPVLLRPILAKGADALLHYERTGRALILAIPESHARSAADLVEILLHLLPSSI